MPCQGNKSFPRDQCAIKSKAPLPLSAKRLFVSVGSEDKSIPQTQSEKQAQKLNNICAALPSFFLYALALLTRIKMMKDRFQNNRP